MKSVPRPTSAPERMYRDLNPVPPIFTAGAPPAQLVCSWSPCAQPPQSSSARRRPRASYLCGSGRAGFPARAPGSGGLAARRARPAGEAGTAAGWRGAGSRAGRGAAATEKSLGRSGRARPGWGTRGKGRPGLRAGTCKSRWAGESGGGSVWGALGGASAQLRPRPRARWGLSWGPRGGVR